jgi:hypothetical protein
MKVLDAVKDARWRAAILAMVLTGALAANASAAISALTMDRTAQLSPGRLHATLTGTVTCDAGSTVSLNGQIVQPKIASGFGGTSVACDGTSQTYAIDVGPGIFGPAAVFKPGKASAQVSTFTCDQFTCTTKFTDAIIRLTK